MKKKIIFMIINLNVGGTEKALLNMISEMPEDKYEITILMLDKFGEFLNYIPREVHVEYLRGYKNIEYMFSKPPKEIVIDFLKKRKVLKALYLLILHLISKLMRDRSVLFKYLLNQYPILKDEYDIAVAYAGPMDLISYFVANKIKAKKKIQWIHFDISKIGFNRRFASKIYKKFDKIYVVSNEGKNKFINILPKLIEKTETFFNIISHEYVDKLAYEGNGFLDNFNGIRILTVGRLSNEKGQDLTIRVLAKLKSEGFNIRWYCIGEGPGRFEYEYLIKEFKIENNFILLGSNPNPYPFMKQCDIYVQPSRHEGYCITLSEAKCFDNPIISTNFTGASEQISHGETGLIVNFDETQLYNGITQLIINEKLRNKLKRNLKNELIDTTSEIEKLYKIAESI